VQPPFDARATPPGSARARSRVRVLGSLAAALLVVAAAVALGGACTTMSVDVSTEAGSGDDSAALDRASCPKAAPTGGALCLLPEGTTCDFGGCGITIARCSQGAWRYASNTPPTPPCPEAPPNPDVACPACWPAAVTCPYGSTNCSAADASANTAVASCPHGTWVLDIRPCRDGGGSDVQGDGGLDAD
jgi:hypothetical protein